MTDTPAVPPATTEGTPAPRQQRELVIVQSRVQELVRARDKRVTDKFLVALSELVEQAITKAAERAAANGRSTLRPEDL
jgi:histone H3/H4